MHGLFITATDTGAGKTHCTNLIAKETRSQGVAVGAYKPVCTGSERSVDGSIYWEDIQVLSEAVGNQYPPDRICPQTFDAPLAPSFAASVEGRRVDEQLLRDGVDWWKDQVDSVMRRGGRWATLSAV